MNRSPVEALIQMRSRTEVSVGSWNGVTAPLRASNSQAMAKATIEPECKSTLPVLRSRRVPREG